MTVHEQCFQDMKQEYRYPMYMGESDDGFIFINEDKTVFTTKTMLKVSMENDILVFDHFNFN